MTTKITYFVHGTTTDNEHDLATGWLDGELSLTGRQQAAELGRQVADQRFDYIFCSDLQRAIDSAQLGFGERYAITQDRRLRECNYGDFTGHPAPKFKDRMADYIDTKFPHGESYRDVEARMRDFLKYIEQHYAGKHIAFVAHQAPQLALDVILGGKSWPQAITEDWRKRKAWQPGWVYLLRD